MMKKYNYRWKSNFSDLLANLFPGMIKKREEVVARLKELLVKIESITMALESEDFKSFTLTTR